MQSSKKIKTMLNNSSIRDVLSRSWKRCLKLGLSTDILEDRSINPVNETEFSCLLRFADSIISDLNEYCTERNYIIAIADVKGIIIKTYINNSSLINSAEKINVVKGANWSESSKGTNAIGTAIIEKKPIKIKGKEHFCNKLHDITSVAAPIFIGEDNMLAVVNFITFEKNSFNMFGMAITLANALEKELILEKNHKRCRFCYDNLTTIIESMTEGLLAINKEGIINYINTMVVDILQLEDKEYKYIHLSNIIKNSSLILKVFDTKQGFSDREVVLETKKDKVRVSISTHPIEKEDDKIEGLIVIIRRIENVRRMATKMIGSQVRFTFEDIITDSKKMKRAISVAKLASKNDSTILLKGKSGTGKEMFAQAIHNHSPRRGKPFIPINVGAIPRDLGESEFFGYEEGAFTGAKKGGKVGKFELANGGTIFLDEIGDMSLSMQQYLLRVLQEREITRIGGEKAIPIDIRIISATKKDLKKEVEIGNFRKDLYYRLNVIYIPLPDLVDRKDDIEILVNHLVPKLSRKLGISPKDVSGQAMEYLKSYKWPGNVRELENTLEGVITFAANDNIILPTHLPRTIKEEVDEKNCDQRINNLEEIEKEAICRTLKEYDGNITRSAKMLGIARNTLYRKMENFNIEI